VPITIAHVLVSTDPGGGPQHVLDVAAGLHARGWRPIVVGPPDGAMVARFRAAGLDTAAAHPERLGPLTVARLVRLIRRERVRLVHSHGKGAGLHARLAARITGVPAVHTLHGIHYERYGPAARAAYLTLERRLSRWTRVVVNVSRAQEAEGLALGLFTRAQSRVILNGVDGERLAAHALERGEARVQLGLPPVAPVIGTAARFDPVKHLDLLVHTLATVPAATLVLIGDGPEAGALRALAARLGVAGRVHFVGAIPEAALLFRAFDVFAAVSRKEGLPLAVIEAMALGLPVVATDIAAHREVLGPGASLVEGTEAALAKRLEALLADVALRARLGAENRTRAQREFDAGSMVSALGRLYGDILGL
jgi:glycosyltransferase involved in cell wall biosynthesis